VAGHAWSIPTLWVKHLASARSVGQMRRTAQGVVASTRDSSVATGAAMAEVVVAKLQRAIRFRPRAEREPPLADESPSALQAYLDAVTDDSWSSTSRQWARR
jgi:hypothetical protein